MCRNYFSHPKAAQRGFSIVLALFIILVGGLLAGALINTNSISADAVAREVLSSRALLAAESAAQRAAQGALGVAGNCAIGNWNVVAGCTASAVCNTNTVAGDDYTTITATGTCGVGNNLAVRRIEVMVVR